MSSRRARRAIFLTRSGNAYIEYLVAATAIIVAVLSFANADRVKQLGNQYQGLINQAAK